MRQIPGRAVVRPPWPRVLLKVVIFSAGDATRFLRDGLDRFYGDRVVFDAPQEGVLVDVGVLFAEVTLSPRVTLGCVAANGAGIVAPGTKTRGHMMKGADAVVIDLPFVEDPSDIGRFVRHIKHHAVRVRPALVGQVAIVVRTSPEHFEPLTAWYDAGTPYAERDDLAGLYFSYPDESLREVLTAAMAAAGWLRFEVYPSDSDEEGAERMGFPPRSHLRQFLEGARP